MSSWLFRCSVVFGFCGAIMVAVTVVATNLVSRPVLPEVHAQEVTLDSVVEGLDMLRWVMVQDENYDILHDRIMMVDQLDEYVDAMVRLHHDPGINPHNGNETARIKRISATPLRVNGPHWHTTPNLGVKDSEDTRPGVSYIGHGRPETLWEAPE